MQELAVVSWLLPVAEAFLRGVCFGCMAKPFVRKTVGAYGGGAAYVLTVLLLYLTRLSADAYLIYGMAAFAMFLAVCLLDRRNYRQKLFLVATFFAFSWFAAAMAEILYDNLYETAAASVYMQGHPELSGVLWLVMCAIYLILEAVFIVAGIWEILRVYKDKEADMGWRELAMLALPSAMGLIGYEIMRYYRVFYAVKTGRMEKAYDGLMFLFCAVSMIVILAVILLYQKLKEQQEENLQARMLAAQVGNLQSHISRVESFYQDIRGIRHDMANHILTLERLYAGQQTEEARAYGGRLKAELSRMSAGMQSGNPVTDVILQELEAEACAKRISFQSGFRYPSDTQIDAFDVSVILNNALQNAIEHAGDGGHVSIASRRHGNACLIEVRNSFAGELQWNPQTGLLRTTKEKPEEHGYGLSNIRQVAGKYAGDIDITLQDGEFCLCVLLMAE